jgi:hypothetical protein
MLRKIVQVVALTGVVLGTGAIGAGCLDRPVTSAAPTIKTNFTSAVDQSGINKVDILFDIDNSASMGDKQAYLVQAIPQMIARLVTPRCLDAMNNVIMGENASPSTGQCATGTPEFTAVHDMHIGVVTSSLGSRLGVVSGTSPVCDPTAQVQPSAGGMVSAYNDDQGHLINRTAPLGGGPALANAADPAAGSGGFLYWFPSLGNGGVTAVAPPAAPYTTIGTTTTPGTLVGDFTELVGGAGESGCGIESQLESWYRFLIQPDPYATLVNSGGKATWSGVDTTIIQQRHDFLRQDSLVAIIVLSDENDSEIDVRSYGGTGYQFMSDTYTPPRATTQCEANPSDPMCKTCGQPGTAGDPNCMLNGGSFPSSPGNEWGYNLNLRHVHMAQKYALNPQFPLTRYWNGLTQPKVPNRLGDYPMAGGGYAGTNNCTNPLFAGALPTAAMVPDATAVSPAEIGTTLCNLQGSATRTAGDVFYAHIGGVPHQLLQAVPGVDKDANGNLLCPTGTLPADCPQKDALAPTDWVKILGTSAAAYTPTTTTGGFPAIAYNYNGIDPHMIESMTPRNMLPANQTPASNPATSSLSGPTFAGTAVAPDPVNGREWTTNVGVHSLPVDREYACIFQLPVASQRDCSKLGANTVEGNSCDCVPGGAWSTGGAAAATNNTSDQVPPLCGKVSTDGSITSSVADYTVQVAAKAYPTIRELTLANMMGKQGIVSSLCPIHTNDNATGDDPLYGYRPAVNAIVNRLKSALGAQCVPKLTPDSKGTVPCLVLVSFAPGLAGAPTSSTTCAAIAGGAYSNVDPTTLSNFNMAQHAAASDAGGVDLSKDYTCQLNQSAVASGSSCKASGSAPGWCYVTGAGIGGGSTCTQEIAYSSASLVPSGATINLQCISENNMPDAGSSPHGG